jgi:NifB/MoaA-like Fe-S oxidoreductase
LRRLEKNPPPRALHGTIVTGTLFAPILQREVTKLNQRFGTRLEVLPVQNDYFGGDVSVAGLLTGGDIIAANDEIHGDFVIVPRTTLKSDEEIMLDGMTLETLRQRLGRQVYPADLATFANQIGTSTAYSK